VAADLHDSWERFEAGSIDAFAIDEEIAMTYPRMPKVLAVWAVLALLIPTPRAFSQERAEGLGRREAQLDLSAFTLPALPPLSLPISEPSPKLAADELPFGPTSEADFPRVSTPPDAGCEEFLTTRELCA